MDFQPSLNLKYGSDSQYVVFVTDEEEAREAYEYVSKNCTPEYDPIYHYNEGKFVYQKFVNGKEFSMECYVQNGIPHVIGINEKTGMDLPFFVETGDYCPPRINISKETALIEEVKATLIALGVRNSVAHIEIKWTTRGPQIIEVASRMGGVYIYQNIKQVYGFDLIRTACEIACGVEVSERKTPPQKYVLAKFFIPKKSGIITAMKGFDTLCHHEHVIDSYICKKLNDSIFVPPDGYEALGWVLTGGSSYGDVEKKMDQIMATVNLEVNIPQRIMVPERRPLFRPIPLQLPS